MLNHKTIQAGIEAAFGACAGFTMILFGGPLFLLASPDTRIGALFAYGAVASIGFLIGAGAKNNMEK